MGGGPISRKKAYRGTMHAIGPVHVLHNAIGGGGYTDVISITRGGTDVISTT